MRSVTLLGQRRLKRKCLSRIQSYFSGRYYSPGSTCNCVSCTSRVQTEDQSDCEEQEKSSEYHEGGYLALGLGNVLNKRYQIVRKLGWGVFSTVWLSWDLLEHRFVALKVVKDLECDRVIAVGEVEMLSSINATHNPNGKSRIIRMLDWFTVPGENGTHVCMVFEVMGKNLLSLVDYEKVRGIHLSNVKRIVRQILEALSFLHDKCKVIHTDIKPENVLLCVDEDYTREVALDAIDRACSGRTLAPSMVCALKPKVCRSLSSPKSVNRLKKLRERLESELEGCGEPARQRLSRARLSSRPCRINVKIGDFGNAVPLNYDCNFKIQTEPYRAPEVILGASYDCAADVWSVGCLAFELATGRVLFEPTSSRRATRTDNHLACIMQVVGFIPYWLRRYARYSPRYFTKYGTLRRLGRVQKIGIKNILVKDCHLPADKVSRFASFLKYLLVIDPAKRPSAQKCLEHPWLRKQARSRNRKSQSFS